jgi:hypothetical protein
MAPFNIHFLIAETIWPTVKTMITWPATTDDRLLYGQFCFGCVAPDVDKLSATLTQKDSHFFDRRTDYDLMATHRTSTFLRQQADFLCCPFDELPPKARAFVLGYLCHLCVDEVSKHMWRRETWLKFQGLHPGSAFAALDESARARIDDYPAIGQALQSITIQEVISAIPPADLAAIWRGACAFLQAKNAEDEFMVLVDIFDRPTPERRQQRLARFRLEIEAARNLTPVFRIDTLVQASLVRSRSRLADLIEGRLPEPDYPIIND